MKKKFFACGILCSLLFLPALRVAAAVNNSLKLQLYNVQKSRPYFATQKAFIDKFVEQLDVMNFNERSASWRAIDKQIAVDESSFKELNNVYYLVFKTMDNSVIGLVRFKCKNTENGGFKKIETYSYKRYTPINNISPSRFDYIEQAACEG